MPATRFFRMLSIRTGQRRMYVAVRHPELKEKSIIRGYADGSFGPDKIVSYGEVCTMLLRMLGYKEEDVGPFWPADYIAQAQAIGLTDGVTITGCACRSQARRCGGASAECSEYG